MRWVKVVQSGSVFDFHCMVNDDVILRSSLIAIYAIALAKLNPYYICMCETKRILYKKFVNF